MSALTVAGFHGDITGDITIIRLLRVYSGQKPLPSLHKFAQLSYMPGIQVEYIK